MVEVLDSEDDFEVFNRPQSPEAPAGDFSYLPQHSKLDIRRSLLSKSYRALMQNQTKPSGLDEVLSGR